MKQNLLYNALMDINSSSRLLRKSLIWLGGTSIGKGDEKSIEILLKTLSVFAEESEKVLNEMNKKND